MTAIALTINGERVAASVEPRTSLADFLREGCHLTGTHLGCEHGVCGACTVLIDGAPARSCIAYAVACDGSEVRTVEGFAGDPVMARLREAFNREHALQCGFCTPGMLASAYDIVHRLGGGASEAEIRTELAGNICRCTGYMGIVAAIRRVLAEMPASAHARSPSLRHASAGPLPRFAPLADEAEAAPAAVPAAPALPPPQGAGWQRITDSFTIARPPDDVWRLLADVPRMAACMPGATLERQDGNALRGRFTVRMGPVRASFAGHATIERDEAQRMGRIAGGGRDDQGGSQAEGSVAYTLSPERGGAATRVAVVMDFRLQGALAQFGRIGIVRDVVGRVVGEFAANLAALAEGRERGAAAPLDAGRLLRASLWAWLRRLFGLWR